MQNKGIIKLFAIALVLVSIYQLSFTYFTRSVESDAAEYAKGDSKKERAYLDSISGEVVYNFAWLRKYTYNECKEKELNLGLDLRGGMNVTLEISVVDIVRSMANYSTDSTFVKTIRLAQENEKNSQDDFVTLFGEAFKIVSPNGKLAAIFNTIELKDKINYNSTNEEVIALIKKETEGAIENSFNILRTRIDRFGVTQPNIQRLGTSGRVLVELPGIKDPERVRKLLQGTANLEFWETYENAQVAQSLIDANTRIKEMNAGTDKDTVKIATDTTAIDQLAAKIDTTKVKADTTKKEESLVDKLNKKDTSKSAADTSKKDFKNREAFNKENPLFAVLTPNFSQDGSPIPGPVVGISQIKDTSAVNKYLALKQVKALLPRDIRFYWGVKSPKWDASKKFYELFAIKVSSRDGRAPLDGNAITDASSQFGDNNSNAKVSMSMNGDGAKTWARLTKEAATKEPKECIAIVLDGYVYSAPRVQGEIKGGSSEITGDFTINEAKDLANVLKSGKLPAPARIIEEAVVGPSLGQEAINTGMNSFIIAFFVVLLYMILYYSRWAGTIADIALIFNVLFIFGVLASLGAVLTLPGIAGIVLTLGMAVDANVIIYERIREELRAGKGLKLAVSDGYKHAYSAIIDGNVTTILTGIILYIFGSGPVQGFATTLIIGILTSLFSAIFISRLIFSKYLDKNSKITFANKVTENVLSNIHVDFIGMRKYFYAFSIIVSVIGIISMATKGFNYGVDFTGGRTYLVRFEKTINTVDVQKALKVSFGEAPEVKTFGTENNQVKVTTKYMIDNNDPKLNVDSIVEYKLYDGLKPIMGNDITFEDFSSNYKMSSQKVGPTIADDIKVSAIWAVIFSLIGIFFYIFIRFKNWRFGLGGVVSLAHDTLFVLGAFSIFAHILPFSLEIDQAFIAAILTVIGYSINDSVIVYDRIREYSGIYKRRNKRWMMNAAMSSTLGRTLNTSLTTLFVLIVIFIFGGDVIRGFIFAMLIGITIGTYSSIFIASAIVYDSLPKAEKEKKDEE